MNNADILERLVPIFEDTFEDEEQAITLDTKRDDIEGWDSLAQVRLFLAVETEFGFRFEIEEMDAIEGVGDLVRTISSKAA